VATRSGGRVARRPHPVHARGRRRPGAAVAAACHASPWVPPGSAPPRSPLPAACSSWHTTAARKGCGCARTGFAGRQTLQPVLLTGDGFLASAPQRASWRPGAEPSVAGRLALTAASTGTADQSRRPYFCSWAPVGSTWLFGRKLSSA
jgi:hypothetical protein